MILHGEPSTGMSCPERLSVTAIFEPVNSKCPCLTIFDITMTLTFDLTSKIKI